VRGRQRRWRVPARRLTSPPLQFLSGQAVSVLGDGLAVAATVALGGYPRPVFLVAGVTVMMAAAGGWAGACGRPPATRSGEAGAGPDRRGLTRRTKPQER
jgi:hypothetical protein